MLRVSDINITNTEALPSPASVLADIEKTDAHRTFIAKSREQIHNILFGDDPRLLIVAGPCSIHDVKAGREYAERFAELASRVEDRLFLVMRAYFEKPRTSVGWKGLIMDPHLDGSYALPEGLRTARRFLLELIEMGVPTATELLDPITPQYIADLICWSCIGARTTESQTHRQMASGLSMPLGFKNSTDGTITAALNAIKAASSQQTFLGINQEGMASSVTTKGNPNCHIVLRGGSAGANYDRDSVEVAAQKLRDAGLTAAIVVDCSHGNSDKDYTKQPNVLSDVMTQAVPRGGPLIGAMLESNLEAGNQKFPQPLDSLKYGQSITDGCIDWETTERIVLDAHERIADRFQ